jgi:TP901-1 family phage major tail protein
MAGERTGIDILIQVEDPETPGTFKTLGGQRGLTLNRTTNIVSANHKTSGGWDVSLATTRAWGIEADALLLESDEAYEALEDAWENSVPVKVQIKDGTKLRTGIAYISDFPEEAPADDMATISITLQGNGPLTRSTAP